LVVLLAAFVSPNPGPSLFGSIERGLAWLAYRRRLAVIAVGVTALALRAAVLPILPVPYPGVHDEFSYQLMADTFAHGRLTNPTHQLWIHFQSVTVIHQPTYCSVFYPFWALSGGLLTVIRIGAFSYWANSYLGGTVAAI